MTANEETVCYIADMTQEKLELLTARFHNCFYHSKNLSYLPHLRGISHHIIAVFLIRTCAGCIPVIRYLYKHRGRNTMTINEYQALAMRTLNPALNRKDVLINSVMGLCGEAGEAIDLVKKWLAQGHELDRERLARELGDVAWYLAEAATALELPLEQILQGNLDKLSRRYPQGFEAERSAIRLEGDL